MTLTDGEKVLAGLVLDPSTRLRCSPRYDELLLAATPVTESLVTIVYRARKRGCLRVLQLSSSDGRWSIVSENVVPTEAPVRSATTPIEYAEREFHFVPGSGVAPSWVDAERPERDGGR